MIDADIRDPGLGRAIAAERPEVIFHLAAQIDVRASVADPLLDADINILGTINLAQAAAAAGPEDRFRLIRRLDLWRTDDLCRPPRTLQCEPLSPYAVAKVAGELYLNAFSRLAGLQCTHLAFANVYGPRQDPHGEAGVVAIFAQSMLSGRPTRLFGDGGNTRDYVFVDDVVNALVLAAGDGRRPAAVQHRHRASRPATGNCTP